jgi:hypothetical protein
VEREISGLDSESGETGWRLLKLETDGVSVLEPRVWQHVCRHVGVLDLAQQRGYPVRVLVD